MGEESVISSKARREKRAYLVGLLGGEPHGRGLLAADHEVDVVLSPEAVSHRAQEAVGIGRQVNTSKSGLEVQDGADERRVLMGKAVVFLTSPGRSLNVVERAAWLTPCCFVSLPEY